MSANGPSKADIEAAHKTLFEAGLAMRNQVAGPKYTEAALKNGSSDFARPMQEYITEAAWGSIWTRPGLELKTRSLLNVAMLSIMNRTTELGVHVRGAVRNGASEVEIRETLLQAAGYGGFPVGVTAIKVAEGVFNDMKQNGEWPESGSK